MKPPPLGWLLILYGIVCTLLAAGSSLAWYKADRARTIYLTQAAGARVLVDSLAVIKCVPMNAGDVIRVFPAPQPDTLKRVAR